VTKETVTLAVLSVIATIVETEPMPAPQTHLWLALQESGALGSDIDDWYTVLRIGQEIGVWTHTSETIELTGKGREVADWVNAEIEER
jgi:hypothetical protein